jgi:hypothetical protein
MTVHHVLSYLERQMYAQIPMDDHEDYVVVLRETRPPVSPICCPPLPSIPFQFTTSGHIAAAAAQSIPSASAGKGRRKPTAHGALPPLPQSNEPKLEKKQQKKKQKKQEATRLETKARKTKKGNDSDGSSSSSTTSSPGLESENATVRQHTIVAKADACDTDHKGETEDEDEDEDELVLLKLNKLKSLSRSLVSVMLDIGTPLTIDFSTPVVRRAHSGHTSSGWAQSKTSRWS